MTFEQFLHLLLKKWRFIVVCCLFLGAGTALGSKLITPIYQSTTLVQVTVGSGSNQSDYTSLLASQQLVQTEADLATSDAVLRQVASHYKDLTVDQLANEVTATPKPNTQLFEINVQDQSPTRAAALADDVATTLARQQLQMTQQGTSQSNLIIVQNARPLLKPVRPDVGLNTGAGLLAGLLLGILLAVVFERLKMHALTLETLSQSLNGPVIGTVWQARSKKQKDIINLKRHDPNVEAYRMLCTSIGFAVEDKSLPFLMVTSALSGEGKSTVAASLAISLAKMRKNTLLIDTNISHPTIHKLFELPPENPGFGDAILQCSYQSGFDNISGTLRTFAQPYDASHRSSTSQTDPAIDPPFGKFMYSVDVPNLWVMPCGPFLPGLPELLNSTNLQKFIKELEESEMDFVIFDAETLVSAVYTNVLASKVDGVLVVVDVKSTDKSHLEQLRALLVRTKANVIGCIANKQYYNSKATTVYYPIGTESNEKVVVDNPYPERLGIADRITAKLFQSPKGLRSR